METLYISGITYLFIGNFTLYFSRTPKYKIRKRIREILWCSAMVSFAITLIIAFCGFYKSYM